MSTKNHKNNIASMRNTVPRQRKSHTDKTVLPQSNVNL